MGWHRVKVAAARLVVLLAAAAAAGGGWAAELPRVGAIILPTRIAGLASGWHGGLCTRRPGAVARRMKGEVSEQTGAEDPEWISVRDFDVEAARQKLERIMKQEVQEPVRLDLWSLEMAKVANHNKVIFALVGFLIVGAVSANLGMALSDIEWFHDSCPMFLVLSLFLSEARRTRSRARDRAAGIVAQKYATSRMRGSQV